MKVLTKDVTLSSKINDDGNIEFKLAEQVLSENEIAINAQKSGLDYITIYAGDEAPEDLLEILQGLYK